MRMLKNEAGQALTIALVLLALGGLLVVPVLSLTSTNLNANRQINIANQELYAADAGVENVMWRIMYEQGFKLPTDIAGKEGCSPFTLNGRNVVTNISTVTGQENVYKITSTATSSNGHSTKIQCYINAGSKYSFLFDYAVVSAGQATIKPGSVITGDVVYSGTIDNKGTISGKQVKDTTLPTRWPTETELNDFYKVTTLPLWTASSIDVKNYLSTGIGPFRREGDLTVDNSGASGILKINGTIYVTGNLTFNQPGASKSYTIDLNNQTIYAKGNITFPSNNVSLIGSGTIIAVQDLTVYPGTGNSPSDFILLLSLKGRTYMYPSGEFYGTVAGYTESYIGSGKIITGPPPSTFSFPGMGGGAGPGLGGKAKILTYTINP